MILLKLDYVIDEAEKLADSSSGRVSIPSYTQCFFRPATSLDGSVVFVSDG